jgi:phosphomannomutase
MGVNSEETNKTSRRAIVHTSMHGVGHIFAKEMFRVLGLPKVRFISEM